VIALESGSYTNVMTAVERYLPYLYGLVVSIENNPNLRLNAPLNFAWSSAFSSKSKPHYFTCYTYKFEAIMVVLTYAIAHINKTYEIMGTLNDDNFEESTKKAATLLREAAGILEYLSTRELPRWTDLPKERPLELSSQICSALADYCCATAQTITLRKAVKTGTTSKAVMAKLAADVWKKIEGLFKNLKVSPEYKELGEDLKTFFNTVQGLAKASTYKFMGQSLYEQEQYGQAVAYLNVASQEANAIKIPSPTTSLGKFKVEIERAVDDINHVQRSFANENNHIYFKPIPNAASLEIPEQKSLMTPTPWMPPRPAFDSIN